MSARSPKAVLFDLDGVIIDSEAVHHRAYDVALEPWGVPGIPFGVYANHFSNRGRGVEYLVRAYPSIDPVELKRRKDQVFLELIRRDAGLCPGAAAAVERLAERWSLALATGSARDVALLVLERFALRDRFEVVVAREDYARDKPAPDAFLRAAELLGSPPGGCLVIEDSLKGLGAAAAAGMPCIVVPNDYTRDGVFHGAAAVARSMQELTVDFVEGVFARSA